MTVYMRIPAIEGEVTEEHHAGWIDIDEMSLKVEVADLTKLAFTPDPIKPIVKLELVEIQKASDSTLADLMNWMVSGDLKDSVVIENCHENGQCQLRYTLLGVLILEFGFGVAGKATQDTTVTFKLKYDELELEQFTYGADNVKIEGEAPVGKRDFAFVGRLGGGDGPADASL